MPSGITACIYDDASFEEFVWMATVGIGYHRIAEAPLEHYVFEVAPFYSKRIKDAQAYLNELLGLSEEEKAQRAQAAIDELKSFNEDDTKGREEKKQKLLKMRQKVEDWTPPTDEHISFKNFMLSQIDDTIRFDCSDCSDYLYDVPELNVEEWYSEQITHATDSIQDAIKSYNNEKKNVEKANEWLEELRKSVPPPNKT